MRGRALNADPTRKKPQAAIAPFIALASAFVLVLLGAVALAIRFDFSALGLHGALALFIGVVATTALGVGLMALVFHSSRAGHDDEAPTIGPDGR